MNRNQVWLFTGGCRSGKSALAQQWVEAMGKRPVYIATARRPEDDPELLARIARHQRLRNAAWVTLEPEAVPVPPHDAKRPFPPLDAAAALRLAARQGDAALFDCVTLWLSGLLLAELDDDAILRRADDLAEGLSTLPIPVALVTNETGSGLAPSTLLGRRFRDLAGLVNQRLAEACPGVVLAVCGLPLVVKGTLPVSLTSEPRI